MGFLMKRRFLPALAAALLLALALAPLLARDQNQAQAQIPASAGPLRSYADVAEIASPAVVNIQADKVVELDYNHPFLDDPMFRRFFGLPDDGGPGRQRVNKALGSGVVISSDGYIITNDHVISGADRIKVTLTSGETYEAKIIGRDAPSDLAVIKIDAHNLPYAEFGDTSHLRVGDWVVAIGNALGLKGGPTVTIGIVSNIGRSFEFGGHSYYDVIQTDAAINPGNSGGPLVGLCGDLTGKVVGINTFIISETENIGFAINASTAKEVFEQLVTQGKVRRPWLGVWLQTVTPDIKARWDLHVDRGVLIFDIVENGPAARAGLRRGDVITEFEGVEVEEATDLIKLLWRCKIGQKVHLVCWRGAQRFEVFVTLGERPEE